VPSSPAAQPAAPATRPKLNLAKRTVSEAQPSDTGSASDAKASPFGAARPVDTAAKEREVAEKREIAIRQKKEADDKAREEKKAREAPSKEDAESAADADEANGEKENGSGPKYEILSRDGDDGEENEAQDAPANGEIVDDKAVKPREFTRDPPKGPRADRRGDAPARGGASTRGGDSWRGRGDRKSSTPNARTPKSPEPESTGEKLEDDGWSTVAAKPRGGRGRGGARAIAS
jgi:translation initiation factor 4B